MNLKSLTSRDYIRQLIGLLLLSLSSITNASTIAQLDSTVSNIAKTFMKDTGYVGLSVAVNHSGKTIYQQSFGFADQALGIAFDQNTVVGLGSNTKVLTATAILQLKDNNKIQLDSAIKNYLPMRVIGDDKITVRQLLCHTSGLPNVYGEGEFTDYAWQQATSMKNIIAKLNTSQQVIKPGEKYSYNNTGYILLGLITEHLSGQSLGDYFRDQLFAPLKLQNSYYLADTVYIENMSKGYKADNGRAKLFEPHELTEYRIFQGAGAVGGTLSDYMRWFSAIAKGELLSDTTTAQMQTPCKLNSGQDSPEGLGIESNIIAGEKALNGGGVANGFLSLAYYFPHSDLTIGFVGNTEADWGAFHRQYYPAVLAWFKTYNKGLK
ncbi:MAG: D-alanyl-D-alanine carboxypeptidase [Phenylobacterium sp.]|jgi:D-alanyl-D-alanine carboxypeptidase